MIFVTLKEIERVPTPQQMIDVARRFITLGTFPEVYVTKTEKGYKPFHAVDAAILEAAWAIDPAVRVAVYLR